MDLYHRLEVDGLKFILLNELILQFVMSYQHFLRVSKSLTMLEIVQVAYKTESAQYIGVSPTMYRVDF